MVSNERVDMSAYEEISKRDSERNDAISQITHHPYIILVYYQHHIYHCIVVYIYMVMVYVYDVWYVCNG